MRMKQIDGKQVLEQMESNSFARVIMRSISHEDLCRRHNCDVISEFQNTLTHFDIFTIHKEVLPKTPKLIYECPPRKNHATGYVIDIERFGKSAAIFFASTPQSPFIYRLKQGF